MIDTLIRSIQDNSFELGLTWRLRPGTVTKSGSGLVQVVEDGDVSRTRIDAISLLGYMIEDTRVMLLHVPPSTMFILGIINRDYPPPGSAIVSLRQDVTTQSIANAGAGQFITWDTAVYMPFGGWTTGTDFTLPFDGMYLCAGRGVFAANATSRRGAFVNKNNTTASPGTIGGESVQAPATGTCQVGGSGIMELLATDVIGLRVIQNSGAPLNTAPNTDNGSSLDAIWL